MGFLFGGKCCVFSEVFRGSCGLFCLFLFPRWIGALDFFFSFGCCGVKLESRRPFVCVGFWKEGGGGSPHWCFVHDIYY